MKRCRHLSFRQLFTVSFADNVLASYSTRTAAEQHDHLVQELGLKCVIETIIGLTAWSPPEEIFLAGEKVDFGTCLPSTNTLTLLF